MLHHKDKLFFVLSNLQNTLFRFAQIGPRYRGQVATPRPDRRKDNQSQT